MCFCPLVCIWHCLDCFSCCCDKIQDKSDLRESAELPFFRALLPDCGPHVTIPLLQAPAALIPLLDGCSSSTVSQNKAFSLQFLLLRAFYHLGGGTALGRQRQADLVYKASSRRTARTSTQRNAISNQSINQSIKVLRNDEKTCTCLA